MKYTFAIIFALFCLCSCKEEYEKAVDNYIKENFNDPKSYECVELGKPKEITLYDYSVEVLKETAKEQNWSSDSIWSKLGGLRDFLESKGNNPDKVLLRYVEHTYRANNRVGAKVLFREKWYLNEDMTKITSTESE